MGDKPPRVRRQSARTMLDHTSIAPLPSTTEAVQAPSVEPVMPPVAPAETPMPQHTIPNPTLIEEKPMITETQTVKPTPTKRSKLGYAIRDDLIKKCKQIALDEDRFVYEVVEELLEEGIARHQRSQEI